MSLIQILGTTSTLEMNFEVKQKTMRHEDTAMVDA